MAKLTYNEVKKALKYVKYFKIFLIASRAIIPSDLDHFIRPLFALLQTWIQKNVEVRPMLAI